MVPSCECRSFPAPGRRGGASSRGGLTWRGGTAQAERAQGRHFPGGKAPERVVQFL